MNHNRYDSLTSDGDFTFIVNCFIPMNRNNYLFPEQLRALWTALCFHHGVDSVTGGRGLRPRLADHQGRRRASGRGV